VRILYVAEIVGKAGVYAVKKALPGLVKEKQIDFVVACADGTTGGAGLGKNHAAYLRKLGIDVLTLGESGFFKKDLVQDLGRLPWVLRPANLPPESPGFGSRIFRTKSGAKIGVVVFIGQSGFSRMHGDNPFLSLPSAAERLRRETPYVLVDFHASATAEKISFSYMADGHVSAVFGSHARVQTADELVLQKGTAYITDAGRTGSVDSVGGCDPESRVKEYVTGIPDWTRDAWARPELQGVVVDLKSDGSASSIERVRVSCPEVEDGRSGKDPEHRGEDGND